MLDIEYRDLGQLKCYPIHKSWIEFINKEEETLTQIVNSLYENNKVVPFMHNALKFFQLDLNKMKICIVGLDPYNQVYNGVPVATGRAFEVGNLNSWMQSFNQKSLQNILRILHKDYNNITNRDEIKKLIEIREEIKNNKFKILPPSQLFKYWENQGVLLLNRYLTCEEGKPECHKQIWSNFSDKLFKYISNKNPEMIWFLWGNKAQQIKSIINDNGVFYLCKHPRVESKKDSNEFLQSNCFKDTMNIIDWIGVSYKIPVSKGYINGVIKGEAAKSLLKDLKDSRINIEIIKDCEELIKRLKYEKK